MTGTCVVPASGPPPLPPTGPAAGGSSLDPGNGASGSGSQHSDNQKLEDPCVLNMIECLPPVAPNINLGALGCSDGAADLMACAYAIQSAQDQFDAAVNSPLGRLFHSNGVGDSAASSASKAEEAVTEEADILRGDFYRVYHTAEGAVVPFPLVPVTPMTRRACEGCP